MTSEDDYLDKMAEWQIQYEKDVSIPPLWEHLGWTREEYKQWVTTGLVPIKD